MHLKKMMKKGEPAALEGVVDQSPGEAEENRTPRSSRQFQTQKAAS